MLYEDAQVKEVDKDRGRAHQYMGQEGRVDFSQISREKAVLSRLSASDSRYWSLMSPSECIPSQ